MRKMPSAVLVSQREGRCGGAEERKLNPRIVFLLLICLAAAGLPAALAQSKTGTIKAHVNLTGKLPGNPFIRMGMAPVCSKINAGKRVIQEFVVAAADGSLGNVFVRL